jgi:hypothetical protein
MSQAIQLLKDAPPSAQAKPPIVMDSGGLLPPEILPEEYRPAGAAHNEFLKGQIRDVTELVGNIRNNRDLGDRFERMMQQFFRVDPLYAELFAEVWMWNQWPSKGQVGDVGIDLVAQHRATGEYWAIQCKFYLPEHTLSKADLDSFFTALVKPLFSKGLRPTCRSRAWPCAAT